MASKPFYEKGRYLVRLGKHDVVEKPAGPQLVLRFQVLGLVTPTGFQETQQYERTFYRVINEKTAEYAIEDLKSLGYNRASFADLDPDSDFTFEGAQVEMFCNHEVYQGNEQERWSVARKLVSSDIEGKRVEKKQLRALDNLFGKALKAGATVAKAQPAAAMTEGITDDDVPF